MMTANEAPELAVDDDGNRHGGHGAHVVHVLQVNGRDTAHDAHRKIKLGGWLTREPNQGGRHVTGVRDDADGVLHIKRPRLRRNISKRKTQVQVVGKLAVVDLRQNGAMTVVIELIQQHAVVSG